MTIGPFIDYHVGVQIRSKMPLVLQQLALVCVQSFQVATLNREREREREQGMVIVAQIGIDCRELLLPFVWLRRISIVRVDFDRVVLWEGDWEQDRVVEG